jgi:hypothetical protein
MELDPEEMRILGCLAEKQLTTPAQYPLTLNALTLACNQTSSREPVVSWDEPTVEAAVTRVKVMGLARFFHPSHGRSVLRYGHTLDDALGVDVRQLALLTVLMLRGPQTLAELRTRTQRMAEFTDTREVESDLEGLARFEPPLVARLDRGPGQKEERYAQLLGKDVVAVPSVTSPTGSFPPTESFRQPGSFREPESSRVEATPDGRLATEVAELRAEVVALRRDVDDLRAQLGV